MTPTPRTSPPAPIRRPPKQRSHHATGRDRLETVLRRYRAQLKPGAFEVLCTVAWADLHATRDAALLDSLVRSRLARPDHRGYLVDRFDPKGVPSPLVPLHRPPVGINLDGGRTR